VAIQNAWPTTKASCAELQLALQQIRQQEHNISRPDFETPRYTEYQVRRQCFALSSKAHPHSHPHSQQPADTCFELSSNIGTLSRGTGSQGCGCLTWLNT
jgi:hypothetical protein